MGSLKLYDTSLSYQTIADQRAQAYLALSSEEKFYALLALNRNAVALNGGKPLKTPQGKGLVIKKSFGCKSKKYFSV
ncbi:MAG: hypothetical protein EAZ15_00905 [Sphingobacteriales bacterium]|nr:MAG: hypothetical protein EAZ15_00905 [Sphingobacteriales bacterium]